MPRLDRVGGEMPGPTPSMAKVTITPSPDSAVVARGCPVSTCDGLETPVALGNGPPVLTGNGLLPELKFVIRTWFTGGVAPGGSAMRTIVPVKLYVMPKPIRAPR